MTSDTRLTATDSTASAVVVVLTTLPVEADAEAFGETLVKERLAACVSVGAPMTSIYTWNGAIERGRERQVLVKTVRDKIPMLKARLAALHPYDVPELLVLPVAEGGEAYLAWVRECTAG
ncbi:MAG: divalent-cation tolerance protein CutA [Gemmatimonadetes bacterium]|nr:divalent-cation tolerance protein CutA [Gemmatimonadota bacterium]